MDKKKYRIIGIYAIKPINWGFISLTVLLFISCGESKKEKVKRIHETVNRQIAGSNGKDPKVLANCLKMIDSAIEINDKNFNAYFTKSTILMAMKDINGLMDNNEKMIIMWPDKPLLVMQRGFYFDLQGNNKEAEEFYKLGIEKYEVLLKTKLNKDFNFRLEYVTSLELLDTFLARKELNKMKEDFPKNEGLKEFEFFTKQSVIDSWEKRN